MEQKLNHLLANLAVEAHKLQHFHWYVKGRGFFTLHAKLEEYYDFISEAVDAVAENILMLGGQPLSTMKELLAASNIPEPSPGFAEPEAMMPVLIEDYEALLAQAREIKKAADEESFYSISALMDDYIAEFYKTLWMMKQWSA